ncbi:unnamed protein product [Gongylonema pulchrum]|uniref:Uncharacterized protein n=1 Tax=Gongylonema pulchrum TaxID=637853 RepID=A0A183ES29_9BILA|nr:unnamed protein product [Gongylonema pulchrum]
MKSLGKNDNAHGEGVTYRLKQRRIRCLDMITMWEFSKSQKSIHEWKRSNAAVLSSHLCECRFNVVDKFDRNRAALLSPEKQDFSTTVRRLGERNQCRTHQILQSINH